MIKTKNNQLNLKTKVKRPNQEMRKSHKNPQKKKEKNPKMYQMKKTFKLKVITESLMLPLTQRENALKDSGLVPSKWDGKWTNSQETSIF